MDSVSISIPQPTHPSLVRGSLPWIGVSLLAAPLGILLHELGHLFVGIAFRFPGLVLHYGSVSNSAADAGFPLWQQALQAAAGPLVTLLIVLGSCLFAARSGIYAWTVAPAFAAGLRSVAIGLGYLLILVRHPGAQGNFDEANAARGLGLPPTVVVAVSTLLILCAWVFLIRRMPAPRRILILGSIAVGTVAGLALYVGWLGPLLLP